MYAKEETNEIWIKNMWLFRVCGFENTRNRRLQITKLYYDAIVYILCVCESDS